MLPSERKRRASEKRSYFYYICPRGAIVRMRGAITTDTIQLSRLRSRCGRRSPRFS